jgi:hypothetical protein
VTARTPATSATALRPLQFLPSYYEALDAGRDILPRLTPNFTFSFIWADESGAREFAGSYDEFHGYMAQREPEGQRHHLDLGVRDENREVALGYTTRHGERLGTFTSSVWLDGEGRAERLYSARTLAFGDVDLTPAGDADPGPATFLPSFLETLDETPIEIVPMLGPGLRFAILWSDDKGVHEFAGGLAEYRGYLEQREPEGQRHHLSLTARAGPLEVALGYTTRWGDELGTFMMFTQLDERGQLQRLLAARTLAFRPIWNL